MKKLRWSMAAANDLEEINNYLHTNHPAFADETIRRIYTSAKSLRQFPEKGVLERLRERGNLCSRRCHT